MEKNNGLLKGSLTLLLLFNVFNLLNLIFQIFVAHKLSVVSYGIFTALFSVVYVFGIFSESIQLSVTKHVAKNPNKDAVVRIYNSAMKGSFTTALIMFCAYVVFFAFANYLFEIPFPLILLNGLSAFFALSSPVVRGVLQGQKKFFELGINTVVEGISKLALGGLFLVFGWGIYGVTGAVVISMALPILYGISFQIRDVTKNSKIKEKKGKISLFRVFTPRIFTIMACILLFFMLDIFLARAVLSPILAGYYAIASTIAKMAFIGSQPISKAMLTHATTGSELQARNIFKRSLAWLTGLLLIGMIFSLFFGELVVFLFSGAGKSDAASILPILVLAQAVISIANLILFYKIARDKTNRFWILPILVFLFIVFIITAPGTLIAFSLYYLIATIVFLILSSLLVK